MTTAEGLEMTCFTAARVASSQNNRSCASVLFTRAYTESSACLAAVLADPAILPEQGCTVSKVICRRDQRSLGQVQLHSASASEHYGEPAELPDHAGPACTGLPLAGICTGVGLGYR